MPEDVTVREDLQVIQVISHDDVTSEDFKKTLNSIVRLREDRGLNKVLVDGTAVTSYPSTLPIFEFGSQIARSLMGVKMAIAITPETRGESAFFETVTQNRGGIVRVFDTLDAALAWLKE